MQVIKIVTFLPVKYMRETSKISDWKFPEFAPIFSGVEGKQNNAI